MSADLHAQLVEVCNRHNQMAEQLSHLATLPNTSAEAIANLERGKSAAKAEYDRLQNELDRENRLDHVRRASASADRDNQIYSGQTTLSRGALPSATDSQRQAHAALEFAVKENRVITTDADRVAKLIDTDHAGTDAAYVAAIGNPHYATAFCKALTHGPQASLRMTHDEAEAMRAALIASDNRERFAGGFSAGPIGVGGGDLPLPLSVDPTVQLTSSGVVDPIREAATVVPISTSSYKMATSPSMTAAWASEGEEVTDGSPTFTPIVITPQRAHTFARYSFETSEDWDSLQSNLMRMLADAKATLEADAWLNGTGEDDQMPEGIITSASTAVVITSSTATALEVSDLTLAQDDLAPRYQQNAQWYTNLATRNAIDQIVAQADPVHAKIVTPDGQLLRRVWNETSSMAGIAASNKPVIYGDLRQAYRIVDRIGMSVQLVPQVFGTVANLPTGTSGIYCWWRTSAALVDEQAIRILKMHA